MKNQSEIWSTKIVIPTKVDAHISYWVQKCPVEIHGIGRAERIINQEQREIIFFIHSVHLMKQIGNMASVATEAEDLGKLMYETKDLPGEPRLQWHSHVKMGLFWSGTDIANMKKHLNGDDQTNQWSIEMVTDKNHPGTYKIALVTNYPCFSIQDNLPYKVQVPLNLEEQKILDEEYQRMFKMNQPSNQFAYQHKYQNMLNFSQQRNLFPSFTEIQHHQDSIIDPPPLEVEEEILLEHNITGKTYWVNSKLDQDVITLEDSESGEEINISHNALSNFKQVDFLEDEEEKEFSKWENSFDSSLIDEDPSDKAEKEFLSHLE